MFGSLIRFIVRNFWKNRSYTAINIAGLSIGLAACLLILAYIRHELSYDRFNENADRIVRVYFGGKVQGNQMLESTVMPPLAAAFKADFPEVKDAARLREAGEPPVEYKGRKFRGEKTAWVDPNFFSIFTLPLIQGDARTALNQPNAVVVSSDFAARCFGPDDPVGKMIQIENQPQPCVVTAVMKPIPDESHFHFDILASMNGLEEARSDSWMSSNFFTYLLLDKGLDYRQLAAKLPQEVDKYIGPHMQQALGMTLAEFRNKGNDLGFNLQPLTDIHFSTGFAKDLSVGGDIRYVYVFSAIALFILLIACINFMNLSTAGAAKRAREVGIRKMMGAPTGNLIGQFMLESFMLTGISLLAALVLVYAVLPWFNELVGLHLVLNPVAQPWLLPGLAATGIVTALLAGAYPAFFMSSFQPVKVLKGKLTIAERRFGLRSGLVTFQFFISILLIISTLVVNRQLAFIRNKNLGYQKDQVLILPDVGALGAKVGVMRNHLSQDPRVLRLSISGFLPAGESYDNNFFMASEKEPDRLVKNLRYDVDPEYIKTLGMELVAGRNFSDEPGRDSLAIILNETAVKTFGLGPDPLGAILSHRNKEAQAEHYQVIGVLRDFHFRSLHETISPLVMVKRGDTGNIILKTAAGDVPGLLADAKKQWESLSPETPFSYSFLDDRFEQTYVKEQKTGVILGIFSGLTIFVACLGLFGLAMFTAEQRRKEIGIRKVLGASVSEIVFSLSLDTLKLVFSGLALAVPLSWWIMRSWLADFAYRIDIQWWVFVLAGALASVIAFATIAGQALRAATVNPVQSLKNE